jgi:prevent-host-death family protein
MEVDIREAKTRLSKLLERVALGEEVIITEASKPMAKLVRVESVAARRVPGTAKGQFTYPDDFNDPLPEETLREFYQ